MPITLSGESIRYLAPSDIEADPDVRVVFFKTSLNTGWDCPRAEVMMSFRAATDSTNIAQLVGRMVRTPLARRIMDNEQLNTVPLFLPHYDRKGLDKVVAKLSKPDDGNLPIEIELQSESVELTRAHGSEDAFAALSAIPAYIVPRRRRSSQVRRLMKLARLLANDGIDSDAIDVAKLELLGVLDSALQVAAGTEQFAQIVDERKEVEIDAINWDVATPVVRDGAKTKVNISGENVNDLFEATGRKLGEGLHQVWWRARAKAGASDHERTKLELFALCTDQSLVRRLEEQAQVVVQQWLAKWHDDIASLGERAQALYDEVRQLAAVPELTQLRHPERIRGKRGGEAWKKHLFVDDQGLFEVCLNDPEKDVVKGLVADKTVVGWLRNRDRKPWSFCVPYEVDGEDRSFFPDFLVIRRVGTRLVVDIIEPHSIDFSDAAAKAAGLAKFADKHASKFGRIELIVLDGNKKTTFDLVKERERALLKGIKLIEQVRQACENV
jgi:type III restriction enzyme